MEVLALRCPIPDCTRGIDPLVLSDQRKQNEGLDTAIDTHQLRAALRAMPDFVPCPACPAGGLPPLPCPNRLGSGARCLGDAFSGLLGPGLLLAQAVLARGVTVQGVACALGGQLACAVAAVLLEDRASRLTRHVTCGACHHTWNMPQTSGAGLAGALSTVEEALSGKFLRGNARKCKCGSWIQRSSGCPHMTCTQCRFQFCYLCGTEWIPRGQHAHFCPTDGNNNIVQGAEGGAEPALATPRARTHALDYYRAVGTLRDGAAPSTLSTLALATSHELKGQAGGLPGVDTVRVLLGLVAWNKCLRHIPSLMWSLGSGTSSSVIPAGSQYQVAWRIAKHTALAGTCVASTACTAGTAFVGLLSFVIGNAANSRSLIEQSMGITRYSIVTGVLGLGTMALSGTAVLRAGVGRVLKDTMLGSMALGVLRLVASAALKPRPARQRGRARGGPDWIDWVTNFTIMPAVGLAMGLGLFQHALRWTKRKALAVGRHLPVWGWMEGRLHMPTGQQAAAEVRRARATMGIQRAWRARNAAPGGEGNEGQGVVLQRMNSGGGHLLNAGMDDDAALQAALEASLR